MRRRTTPYTAIRSEGALLPPELLERIAAGDRDLPGLRPVDYHLAPNERLTERISRSWSRLVGVWASFVPHLERMNPNDPGTGATRERWLGPLFEELGFGRLEPARGLEVDGKHYPISHLWRATPIHLVGAGVDLDRREKGVAGAARMSPHSLVQEYLNRSDGALWGIVANGRTLRLLRDNASLTRQAYVEFDLEAIFSGDLYPDFALLWLLCHQSRFEGERPEECPLERWAEAARRQGARALDTLRDGVERAIRALGAGFLAHPENAALRERLRAGELSKQDYYRELLRLVYRLIFLFAAEDRDLLHPPGTPEEPRERYARYYSTDRLRRLAGGRRGFTKHPDLYEGLKVVLQALGRDGGCPELGLPYMGSFLFSPQACPELDGARLANRALLEAVRALAFTTEGKVLRPVDYRNMGSEELGSVYESLLELHPELDLEAAAFELGAAPGHERKTTGSYYTPTPLVSALLDSALDPVLDEAQGQADPERALLELKVLDPASGSGHFLVAAAHRIAKRLAAARTGEEEPPPEAHRQALREVVSRCLYGIDVNPMAVELCKVSLWLEAVDPGRPLSFLDHHIVCGNSLLGTTPRLLAEGIPEEAFTALEGDDKAVVTALRKRNRAERKGQEVLAFGPSLAELAKPLAEVVGALEELPGESAEDLHAKEQAWAKLQRAREVAHAKLVADAWCAAFVIRKTTDAPALTTGVLRQLMADPEGGDPKLKQEIRSLAERYRFLHPHLAFPTVFRVPEGGEEPEDPEAGWSGGFDVVLGNPPWEHVELKEQEWFAVHDPAIAAARTAADRKRMIQELRHREPRLYGLWLDELRQTNGERAFLAHSQRYPLTGRGRVNTYAVFAELMRSLTGPRGRTGAIVPSGIATDATTQHFFRDLVERRSLVSLYDFENQGIFPAVHNSYKFCLLTLAGRGRPARQADFVFFAHEVADLADPDRRFTLSPEDFALINPNTRTCPIFRSQRDAELTKAIYRRVPVLVDEHAGEAGNPWRVTFKQGLFNMASDSGLFRTREELEREGWHLEGNVFVRGDERYLPLYEAKMVHHFDHRFGDYAMRPAGSQDTQLPDVPVERLADPDYRVLPRYWVPEPEVESRLEGRWDRDWLLGWRDICRNTDERTVIASVIPRTAVGHKFPIFLPQATPALCAALLADLDSFVLDYCARQKLGGTSLTYFVLKQLPVLPPATYDAPAPWDPGRSLADWISARVLELVYTSWDLEPFARDLGYEGPPFRWDPERRERLRAELDACFFHLYGLTREEVDYVMDTFPIVRRRDEHRHGEYRTKRLILEYYDVLAHSGLSSALLRTHPSAAPSA
jgi:hypothetical protein